MAKAKISYSLTRRPSQSRIAAAYQDIIGERYEFLGIKEKADIVIVHHPPRNYETVYALHPGLDKKYVISCCVSHASGLPELWQRNLQRVQEVWTCSRYCQRVLSQYHPKVTLIPYVVERDFACGSGALETVKSLVGVAEENFYFLSVAHVEDERKNVRTLVESFIKVAPEMPKARLIVKASHTDVPSWPSHPQVVFLPFLMPFEYVNCLYHLAHAYVSAHHCESWGLTLSDAMLLGKPVIATGYSGNMDYMNEENSFLVSFREREVPENALGVPLEEGKWADPDPESLQENLLKVYSHRLDPGGSQRAERGRETVGRFNRPYVAELIYDSIESALQR